MKKIIGILISITLLAGICYANPVTANEQMRAVWISTVYNLDYPKTKNDVETQKREYIDKLDQLQTIGMNTVVVQVRPKADALYKSEINPWSDVLTGTQGKNPGYDPMAFMIEEAHKRGMEFHAWLNPYRVTTSGTDVTALSENHPARIHPEWVFSYNNALYYNPELPQVKQHIADTVKEIVTNYQVDGIHFDDYFYPSHYPLPLGEGKDGQVANARREHINQMIQMVADSISSVNKELGKKVVFGVSPGGIWKNKKSDLLGSNTGGNESYYSVYADTRKWIQNEWIDYVVPQIYWEMGHKLADYETLVKWWSNQVQGTSVKLYIGQGIYRDVVATEIGNQLQMNQAYPEVQGSFYFSLRDLLANRMNCKQQIKQFYQSDLMLPSLPITNMPSSNNGLVNASILNIRKGARLDRPIITKVPNGTQVIILDTLGDWYKVKLSDNTVGWASSTYITMQ